MWKSIFLFVLTACATPAAESYKPNIIFILADDLGYGDVRCLNPDGKIATPHLDRLRAQGMAFTNAHSSSAVCTPTRYGILTGRYNWRSRLKSGVLGGISPPLIEDGRLTVASLLKQQGYATTCIGKWHLGLGWQRKDEDEKFGDGIEKGENGWKVDYTKPFLKGPTTLGFDSFFGIAASLDMVPYTYLVDDRVQVVPTVDKDFPMMLGRASGKTRRGPAAEKFEAEDVLPALTKRAVEFIGLQSSAKPFFIYMPLNAPHTPTVPTKEWQGKSGLNAYGDFVMQTDATVGAVMDAVEKQKLSENTLIIVTSDNGCSPQADFEELAKKGHDPSAKFRGHKADIFDGGHHVPFIVSWPAKVKPKTTSDQIICLTDFMATAAEILTFILPETAGEDSVSFLLALEERAKEPLREAIVHHSINGSFAIRQGKWKLELCGDSGGWSEPKPGSPKAGGLPPIQLYNLEADPAEAHNVAEENPEIVEKLTNLLQSYVDKGRSTPGAPQENTGDVEIRKVKKAKAKKAAA